VSEDNTLSMRARRKYKAQIEKAARDNYIARFNKRMELAKLGVESQKNRNYRQALQCYLSYVDILQRSKGGGELVPSAFDVKNDSAELLMLTGIYWDLAKIYDRVKGKDKTKTKYYLDKFVLFSRGTSYQRLSREMLRKFLTYESPRNRPLFKEAYVSLGGGKCFIATAVEEHFTDDTVTVLRRFRDEVLSRSNGGRLFIRLYYRFSPSVAILLIRCGSPVQKVVATALEAIATAVSSRFFPDGK
jgi:hypothetical protein